jgi:hypothetical protein
LNVIQDATANSLGFPLWLQRETAKIRAKWSAAELQRRGRRLHKPAELPRWAGIEPEANDRSRD